MNDNDSFALSIGAIDGLITSLMITSNAIISKSNVMFETALRISMGSAVVGAASFFVAEYGRLRQGEYRIARLLNPSMTQNESRSHVIRRNLTDAFRGGSFSFIMGFIGAAIPILSYSVLHAEGIYSLTFSYFALGMLGIFLGKSSGGKMSNWFLSLVILGVIMTVVGYFLKIVS
ncbi:MAG: hypothetical protein M1498_01485 [Candidatus Thermoplasmatota archaeon]|nr:hypothetical protein [Candidatus Thermoplasmatota archaeon]